jgi:hypothetical protein
VIAHCCALQSGVAPVIPLSSFPTTKRWEPRAHRRPVRVPARAQEWKTHLAEYEQPSRWRATVQILDTFGPYVLIWVTMYFSLRVSWGLTIP